MNTRTTTSHTYHIGAYWFLFGLFLLLGGCKEEIEIPAGAFEEYQVDLRGEWQVSQVFRNDENVTDIFDFSGLQLRLEMDANGPAGYTLNSGGAPFVVLENGTWSLDDKVYPTAILFTAGNEEETVLFARPPISTDQTFSISFSLGCSDNTYTYEFVKR